MAASTGINAVRHYSETLLLLYRYLAVHNYFPTDLTVDGDLRVIVHWRANSKALWGFRNRNGDSVLEMLATEVTNPSSGADAVGRILSLTSSPNCGGESFYLAVTSAINKAVVVSAVAEPLAFALLCRRCRQRCWRAVGAQAATAGRSRRETHIVCCRIVSYGLARYIVKYFAVVDVAAASENSCFLFVASFMKRGGAM